VFNYHDPTVASNAYVTQIAPYYFTALNMNSLQLMQNGYITANSYYQWGWNISVHGTSAFPIYRNPTTNNLIWISLGYFGNNTGGAFGWTPVAFGGTANTNMFSSTPGQQQTGLFDNRTNQFLGVSKLDGFTLNFHNAVGTDYQQFVYKYNDSANVVTLLSQFVTPPPPFGLGSTGSYTLSTTTNVSTSNYWFYFTGTNVSTLSTFSGTATVAGTYMVVGRISTGTIEAGAAIFSSNTTIISTGTTIASFGIGTQGGGHRGANFGNFAPKYASKTFVDPTTSTTRGFFVPFFDTQGNYNPLYYQWDTLNDTFVQNYDTSVIYSTGTSQATYWSTDITSATAVNAQHGMQRFWYNETFVSGGIRYLMLMQLHGAGGIYDALPQQRTFVTYACDPTTPEKLTFFSKIEVPATPKNIVWLSDDKTIIGIITHSALYIYTFSSANGWVQTGNFPFQFNAVGRDNLGRVWAQDTGIGYGRIHLITLNVPVNIVVTSDQSNYYYAGTVATANLTVNAYSYTGERIATPVKLVIDGGSMTFAGSNLTLTITTSASADTLVPVTITGGGVANIIASAKLN
jgi:hypothetical protein